MLVDGPVGWPRNWAALVNKPQKEAEVAALRESVAKGRPYGGERWSERVAGKLGINLRGVGRPRKEA